MTKRLHDLRWWAVLAIIAAIGFGVIFVISSEANAQEEPFIDVPITIIRGEPGEVVAVAVVPADPGLQCEVTLAVTNMPDSTHEGVHIGVGPLVYANVENGKPVANPTRSFESGGDIAVTVTLGFEGVFSGGFNVTGGCGLPPVVTTTTIPNTTTTTHVDTPIPPPTTTTTEPAPVGGVPAGGGSMAGVTYTFSGAVSVLLIILGVLAVLLAVGLGIRSWRDSR